jgi:hypothetical protein
LKLKSDDEAAALAVEAFSVGPIDPEKAKRVLRKIDTYILPILCLTYGKAKAMKWISGTIGTITVN